MTHPLEPEPRTIRARIHESAVRRVTRIYAATLADILAEALQNARRAGATRVHLAVEKRAVGPAAGEAAVTEPATSENATSERRTGNGANVARRAGEPAFTVTVSDDGEGIADPALLLSFGENGWDDALVRREDAAGFGFASLARRGCTVSSRPRSPDGEIRPGWRLDLAPAHFLGEDAAEVRADEGAPCPCGTAIAFPATESVAALRNAAEHAARHFPLPVVFETRTEGEPSAGETLPRRAFLDGAVHAEAWRGLAFGVFRNRHRGYNDPDLNFLGLTLPVRLPAVETVHGATWTVRADVRDCPELELVLPARKEAVESEFLRDLRDAARLAIFRAMAADPSPRPTFSDWTRAREAGIGIAPPPAELRPWRPGIADLDDWREGPRPVPVAPDSLVMDCDPEPPEAQALWRAAERAGIVPRLFEADRRLAGYPWYDALERVIHIETEVTIAGRPIPLDDLAVQERTGAPGAPLEQRPERIRMSLTTRTGRDGKRVIDLDTDLAFAGEAWSWVGDVLPLVTADSAIRPHELADRLRAAYFSASDDADADSWERQREVFDREALHVATRLLLSDDEACRASIAEAACRELVWLAPRGRTVEIRIRRPDVTVTLGEADPAP
ncbi:MAG: hypothetical protein OXP75_05350 [Rhodospirillales bacterium]|nr:hypothetical protein [Rhodospirillales bacterium]